MKSIMNFYSNFTIILFQKPLDLKMGGGCVCANSCDKNGQLEKSIESKKINEQGWVTPKQIE